MTPLDRAALADALASATAETLRRDASRAHIIASNMRVQVSNIRGGTDDTPIVAIPVMLENAAMHDRLAALALAVAAMQERGDARVEQALTGGDFLCTDTPIHGMPYGGCDLMSALAALLKGDQ